MRKRWLALVVLGASTTAGLHSAADFLSESAARVVKSHLYECTIGSPGHGSTIDHHSVVLDFTCFLKPCPLHEDCTECYTLCTLLRHCKAATVFVSLDGQARGSFFFFDWAQQRKVPVLPSIFCSVCLGRGCHPETSALAGPWVH
jgi:hypothetical protein